MHTPSRASLIHHPHLLTAVLLLVMASSLRAQGIPERIDTTRAAVDTIEWTSGLRAGRDAAEEPDVRGRALVGFFGGLPMVYVGAAALTAHAEGLIPAAVGMTLIGSATRATRAAPPEILSAAAAEHGPTYARAFTEGYSEHLHARRRDAGIRGATAGALTGLGWLIFLLAMSPDT